MNTQYQQSSECSSLLNEPQNPDQPIYVAPSSNIGNDATSAIILTILGFSICFTWPICYFKYRKSDDKLARSLSMLSIILTIIVVGSILAIIFLSFASGILYFIIFIIAYGVSSI
ncbi:hypothetical protein QTN25_008992 [Entamoeba marina]